MFFATFFILHIYFLFQYQMSNSIVFFTNIIIIIIYIFPGVCLTHTRNLSCRYNYINKIQMVDCTQKKHIVKRWKKECNPCTPELKSSCKNAKYYGKFSDTKENIYKYLHYSSIFNCLNVLLCD